MVGRDGRDDDEVELRWVEVDRLEAAAGGHLAEVAGRLVDARDAPLADAGARGDPLVRGVEELRDLVVGEHALGHVDAERAMRAPRTRPRRRPITSFGLARGDGAGVDDGEHELAAAGQLAVDGGLRPCAADGAVHGDDLGLEAQRVAGLHDALEAHLVDAGEEADLAARAAARSSRGGDGGRLGERLDDEHAGHDGVAGEVPGEPEVVVAQRAAGYAAHARLELDDLVDEQEGRAVRQQRLDLRRGRASRRSLSRLRRHEVQLPLAAQVAALELDDDGARPRGPSR